MKKSAFPRTSPWYSVKKSALLRTSLWNSVNLLPSLKGGIHICGFFFCHTGESRKIAMVERNPYSLSALLSATPVCTNRGRVTTSE
ncbi:MAG: hypothetical protein PHN88_01740 [Ignavibacteria bacterium]|nr:hypothetical protein [Ignavibacteria bacterium]